jgi:hypothetical protein
VAAGSPVTITVNQPVQITSQPAVSQSVCASFPVSLSVVATGTGLTYQWFRNGIAVSNIPGQISGATAATLNISQAAGINSGTYNVVVTGTSPCSPVTSDNSILTVNQDIDITSQPVSQTTCEGPNLIFNVSATGAISSYVWRKDGVPVSGGNYSGNNSSSLTITGSIPSNSGNYDVIISGTSGTCPQVISNLATLLVKPIPTASPSPVAQTTCSGNAFMAINISGTVPSTTYNWTRDKNVETTGIASTGSGNISGTLVNTTNGPVTVTFNITPTASSCVGNPVTATVLVNPKPTVTALPSSQNICSGNSITNILLSSPVPGTTFSWTRNNPAVTGIANSGSGDISGTLTNSTNAPVIVTFTITPEANGCQGNPITATVTVNPIPTVTATPSATTICSQENVTTSLAGTVANTQFSWTAVSTGSTGATNSNTAASSFIQTLVAPGPGDGTVAYTVTPSANGCTGTAANYSITVKPLPTGSISAGISGTVSVCKNSTSPLITFTGGNGTAPYTFTYRINGGSSSTVTTSAGNSVSVSAPTGTSGSFVYDLVAVKDATTQGCSQIASGNATVTVIAPPAASISGNTNVCIGSASPAITFSGSNGTSPYIFTYNINGGGSQQVSTAAGNSSVSVAVPTGTAGPFAYNLVSVQESSSFGCSQPQSGTATVNVLPNATITLSSAAGTSSQTICINNPISNITYAIGGSGTGATISAGALPAGVSGNYSNGVFTISGTPSVSGSFNYTVSTTGPCVNSSLSGTINVTPAPAGGTTTPSSSLFECAGANGGIISLAGQTGTVSKWQFSTNGGSTWTDIYNTTTSVTYVNLTQTTWYRAVVTQANCPGLTAYSTYTPISVVPQSGPGSLSAVANPTIICSGSSTLTATGFGGGSDVGALTGGSFDLAGAGLDNQQSPGLWRKIVNGVPTNIEASLNNTINSPFNLTNDKTFLASPCSPVYYNNNPLGGQPNNNKFMAVVGPNTSSLETPIFNLIGLTTASIDWWEAYILEAGASIKIELSTDGGNTYNTTLKTISGAKSFASPTNFGKSSINLSTYVGLSNLRIRFTWTGTTCSTWGLEMATITKGTLPAIYTWNLYDPIPQGTGTPPDHYLNVFTNPSVIVTPPSPNMTGVPQLYHYNFVSTAGGCASNITVTVNPVLVASSTNPNTSICSGQAMQPITFTSNIAGTTYSWTRTNGDLTTGNITGIAASGTGTIPAATLVNTTSSPQTITFSITPAAANSCNATVFIASLVVNPNVPVNLGGGGTICGSATAPLVLSSPGPFPVSVTLSNGVTYTMNSSPLTINVTPASSTTYSITSVGATNCASLAGSGTATVTVQNTTGVTGTWLCGAGDGDWFNPCNWANSIIPTNNIDVIIGAAASCNPVIDPTTSYALANGPIALARNITIDGARNLSFANGGELDVAGNWINNVGPAGFTANSGTVKFMGNPTNTINCASQTISTTAGNTESFNNLIIANTCPKDATGDNVVLNNPVNVNGVFTLIDGIVKTADDKLLTIINPDVNAVVGGATTTYVNGPIDRYTNTTGEYIFPVGSPSGPYAVYRPAIVRPETTSPASYTTTYHPTIEPEDPNNSFITGVLTTEYWDIDRSTGTTNGVIKLPYLVPTDTTHWSTGFQPCQYCVVAIAEPYQPSSDFWYFVNGASNNSGYTPPQYTDWFTPAWIESPLTSPFGTYSFGFFFNVILPVTDFTFTGKAQGADAVLQWTLSQGNDYQVVELQHSRDGRDFTRLITKTINGDLAFQQLHVNPGAGLHYYRLVLKDSHGKVTYSSVLVIVIGTEITVLKGIRPTMVQNETYAGVHSAKAQFVKLKILDMTGRMLSETRKQLSKGENTFNVNTSMLVQGMYTVYMETEDGAKGTFKFIKE